LICGDNLDANLITEKLKLSPNTMRRYSVLRPKDEVMFPSIIDGARRDFDPRLSLGFWRLGLTSKQHKFDLVKQLEFWIENLYPVRSAFQEFNDLGYWSVIDCQIASTDRQLPSIQFRLTKEMQLKLSKLCLDLDFTIYRPTS
jgi:hypothetical protein